MSDNGDSQVRQEEAKRTEAEKHELGALRHAMTTLAGIARGVNGTGEPLSAAAAELLPFVSELIKTAPRDLGGTLPRAGVPRAPDYVGKPSDGAVQKKP